MAKQKGEEWLKSDEETNRMKRKNMEKHDTRR